MGVHTRESAFVLQLFSRCTVHERALYFKSNSYCFDTNERLRTECSYSKSYRFSPRGAGQIIKKKKKKKAKKKK